MISVVAEKTRVDADGPDQVSDTVAPESNRAAIEAARLEFEALPPDSDTEARKTAFIHLMVSRGFWSRRAAKTKADPATKPAA